MSAQINDKVSGLLHKFRSGYITPAEFQDLRTHMDTIMGRITKRFFNDGGQNGESCLFIGGYGRMYGREK